MPDEEDDDDGAMPEVSLEASEKPEARWTSGEKDGVDAAGDPRWDLDSFLACVLML